MNAKEKAEAVIKILNNSGALFIIEGDVLNDPEAKIDVKKGSEAIEFMFNNDDPITSVKDDDYSQGMDIDVVNAIAESQREEEIMYDRHYASDGRYIGMIQYHKQMKILAQWGLKLKRQLEASIQSEREALASEHLATVFMKDAQIELEKLKNGNNI